MDKLKTKLIAAAKYTGRAMLIVAVGKLGLALLNAGVITVSIIFLKIAGGVVNMAYLLDPAIGAIIMLIGICCWLAYHLFNKPKIPTLYQDHAALMKSRIKKLEAKVNVRERAINARNDQIEVQRKTIVSLHLQLIKEGK